MLFFGLVVEVICFKVDIEILWVVRELMREMLIC